MYSTSSARGSGGCGCGHDVTMLGALRSVLSRRSPTSASPLVTRATAHVFACRQPTLLRQLCSPSPSASTAGTSISAAEGIGNSSYTSGFRPNHSSRSRRARLEFALDACRRGEPFEVPETLPTETIGAASATLETLKETGPLKFHDLYAAVNEKFPGVLSSKHSFKVDILKGAIVSQLMKVRVGDAVFKDSWAIRRPGQIRMKIARGKRTRPSTVSAKANTIRQLTRRGVADWRPNERGPGPASKKKMRRRKNV